MTSVSLSKHDINVLEKIKDPESNPYAGIVLDSSLPRDPNVQDAGVYGRVVQKEREIIRSIQQLEAKLKDLGSEQGRDVAVQGYRDCLSAMEDIISEHPNYASARNNRVQIFRRLYGDAVLLSETSDNTKPLIENPGQTEKRKVVATALGDMETSIALLSPSSSTTPISPQAARTLSMAHTQRAAVYLKTAKLLLHRSLDVDQDLKESKWEKMDFEEAASRDLALGGRFGNPIAKGLAVSVNPTAKLCGQIVREAMKKEYGPSFGDQDNYLRPASMVCWVVRPLSFSSRLIRVTAAERPITTAKIGSATREMITFRPPPPDKMKFLKVGRVAIITRGRYAGKKVVIIQPVDNGNKPHPFGHALVAGIERYPSKITRRMSKTRQEKRNKIKPFIKVVNYNHLMPTRYTLELEGLKGTLSNDTFKEVSQREDAKKTVKKVLEERYTSGKNRWFFTPLSMSRRPCSPSSPPEMHNTAISCVGPEEGIHLCVVRTPS
ncbi:hypothetical protein FZEAL_3430 [Fusarium zealandicum]|uniref:60S ribosomal protein L27 n=1 Tax=Fusarium zealandicum TaxID=1053134 RepID=A0A8H4XLU5_9HYPO|nr:hypothetical protein FZEAL_3430 [Fusarium zealandicum]